MKKWEFRKLKATDITLVTNIISAIGIKSIMTGIDISSMEDSNGNVDFMKIGTAIGSNLIGIIFDNYEKCENMLYKLLSDTSNLSYEEVKDLDFDEYLEMLYDFIKKEEFMGFFKRALKSNK